MNEKINLAIARITKECQGNDHLIPFEEYLTSICTTDDVADKILSNDKNLKGCFEKMKSIAKGRAVSGCAYIPPEEGFQIIREYYGIEDNKKTSPAIDIMDLL
jgi:hypothetical protein